jgi:hypothetical protein
MYPALRSEAHEARRYEPWPLPHSRRLYGAIERFPPCRETEPAEVPFRVPLAEAAIIKEVRPL